MKRQEEEKKQQMKGGKKEQEARKELSHRSKKGEGFAVGQTIKSCPAWRTRYSLKRFCIKLAKYSHKEIRELVYVVLCKAYSRHPNVC